MAPTREQRREWGRLGGLKRAQAFTSEYQAEAGRKRAASTDMGALGHKGAQAFLAKYGYGKLYALCREWRLRHPSAHEQQVMDILCTIGLEGGRDYEREFEVEPFLSADFAIVGLRRVIEVNGRVHYDPAFDDPRRPGTREANDAAKLARLGALGWQVLVLDYRHAERFDQMVREFVAGG